MLDRFECYEACVQSPVHVAGFLRALAPEARALGEDFCGTAAVGRRWVAQGRELVGSGGAGEGGDGGRAFVAVGVDLDGEVLARARASAEAEGVAAGLSLVRADVSGGGFGAADVIFVGNFSIGYLHTRASLTAYLAASRARLAGAAERGDGGVFVCDLYGGDGAFRLGALARRHAHPRPRPSGSVIHYVWRHEEADPLTGMVTNSISFRVEVDGEVVAELLRAFVYRWRLWSLPELREAMLETGFRRVELHRDLPPTVTDSTGPFPSLTRSSPKPTLPEELAGPEGDWITLIAAHA